MLHAGHTERDNQDGFDQGGTATIHEKCLTVQYTMGIPNILSQSCLWRVHPEAKQDRPKTPIRSYLPEL